MIRLHHMLYISALASLMMLASACSTDTEEGVDNTISQSQERGPVTLTLTMQSDHITVGTPLTIELQATADAGAGASAAWGSGWAFRFFARRRLFFFPLLSIVFFREETPRDV